MRTITVLALAIFLIVPAASAETLRVGPGEKYSKISQVTGTLNPGDVVEVTGDLADSVKLSRPGTPDRPITIRGVTRVENGRIVRPRLSPSQSGPIFQCDADNYVLEGLEITGLPALPEGWSFGVLHNGDNLTVRNCFFHAFAWRSLRGSPSSGSITVEFCEFDSYGRIDLFGWKVGALTVVRFCYFHDSHEMLLKTRGWRTAIYCNWFENCYDSAIRVVDQSSELGGPRDKNAYPMHTDIVGNVFFQGWSPGGPFNLFSIGAEGPESPGTEGDFNIAHNLFVISHAAVPELEPPVVMLVHGNVDRVNAYNNAFLQYGLGGALVYLRGTAFDTPETKDFVRRRGNGEPVLDGAGNWIGQSMQGVPDEFKNTIRAVNPKLRDFLNGDYRPRPDSPLAGAGFWPIPKGQVIDLLPEYEPQRGIPADLKPKPRRKVTPPSIGPFEIEQSAVASAPGPSITDDAVDMFLSGGYNGTRFSWEPKYGLARQRSLEFLAKGDKGKALRAAKMQFILSPPDAKSIEAAIAGVKEMLVAVDGNDARAKEFESYATVGPAGADGKLGTGDDLKDPIKDVVPLGVPRDKAFYTEYDKAVDERAAFCEPWAKSWYETRKAFVRLDAGDFSAAARILVSALAAETTVPKSRVDDPPLMRAQDIYERINLGLVAVYRARTDTTAGAADFIASCTEYMRFGPAGKDGLMGTPDDLQPPM